MTEHEPVQLIADEQHRLAREFQGLATSAWTAPSRCAGWSNAVVVAHMAFHAGVYRDTITRALKGDSAPPNGRDGRAVTREDFLSLATDGQDALARQAPVDLMRRFIASGDELTDVLVSLTPSDMARPAWHYTGTLSVGILLAYRIYELGFHGWDVRAALDPAAHIRAELCPFLMGAVRQLLPLLCQPESSVEATCCFEVDGQTWTTRINRAQLEEASPSIVSDATIRMDAGTFLLLATMRQTLAECRDQVAIEGVRERAEQLLGASRFRI